MLMNSNYKSYSRKSVFLDSTPFKRVLNFKKSKWKFVKKTLKQKNFWRLKFFDLRKITVKQKLFPRVKKSYSTGLMLKRSLINYYNGSLGTSFFKQFCNSKNGSLTDLLIFPLFHLDILLWKLQLYKSIREVTQDIQCNLLKVNDKIISASPSLKKGDIITLLNNNLFYIKSLFRVKSFFYSFCEFDLYSKTFVLLKGPESFFNKDLTLILKKNVNIKNLFFYLRK